MQTGTCVDRWRHVNGTHVIETSHGEFEARFTINCAGLFSDRVAILVTSSILAANLFLKTTWRRFVLVAIVIPLGILRNGFRIFVIGLLCVHVGPQMIHSLIHRRGGPLFFVVSLVPLLLVLWLLRKGDEQTRFAE